MRYLIRFTFQTNPDEEKIQGELDAETDLPIEQVRSAELRNQYVKYIIRSLRQKPEFETGTPVLNVQITTITENP